MHAFTPRACVLEDNPEVDPVDDDDGVLLEANDEGADTDEDEDGTEWRL